jgi:site-specific DNA-methyltransferase (adenine-specific)
MNENIQIICGEAIDLFKQQPTSSVDLIIADPPYNLGKDYGNNSDSKEFDEYINFTKCWLTEAVRVLKPSGTIYVFMGVRFISYLYTIMERELNLIFSNWIVWHYTQGLGKTKGFSPRHDDILMFNKSKKATFNLDNVRVPQKYYREINNMRGANPGDVWQFSHVHYCNQNRQNHPTQKPEGLIERMILASSNESDLVLDPFCGSGTTLRVCQQLNRHGIGYELNPSYVELIQNRLKEPFHGFDSVDDRMERVPNDLTCPVLREEYLKNHIDWFLKNHENAIEAFKKAVQKKYGVSAERSTKKRNSQKQLVQKELF